METNAASFPNTETVELHVPVMLNEVLEHLNLKENNTLLDMTFGAGGHSKALLNQHPDLKIVALDRDPEAHERALELKKKYPDQIIPILGKFSGLPELLKENQIKQKSFDGILFDLGCSSLQLDHGYRGFSINKEGPLDMRMDGIRDPNSVTAAHVLSEATETELYQIFKVYGEEKQSRKIAREIIEARYTFRPLQRTSQLVDLVSVVCSKESSFDLSNRKTSVATKVFQALRVFVNNELNELNYGMLLAKMYIKQGGRLVALSYNLLEDTIVKRHIQGHLVDNSINPVPLRYINPDNQYEEKDIKRFLETDWKMVNKHVLTPSDEEIKSNPRSKSAKLRAAIRL